MPKWSELFAALLGEKDVEVTSPSQENTSVVNSTPVEHSETQIQESVQQSQQSSIQPNVTSQPASNHTDAEFDALNARIKELEKANQQLVTQGSVADDRQQTPEEIILDLCVGRRKNGRKNSQYGRDSAER